jgi:hypothetical protein
MCDVEPMTETQARNIGETIGRLGYADSLDVSLKE